MLPNSNERQFYCSKIFHKYFVQAFDRGKCFESNEEHFCLMIICHPVFHFSARARPFTAFKEPSLDTAKTPEVSTCMPLNLNCEKQISILTFQALLYVLSV